MKRVLSMILVLALLVCIVPAALSASHPFTDVPDNAWYASFVEYVYENGLMSGTSDTTFSPNGQMTRGMVVTVLYRLAGSPSTSGNHPFTDVKAGAWYETPIAWAYENKIVSGSSATTFSPNSSITREQIVTIFFNYAKYKGHDVSARADISGYSDKSAIHSYAVEAFRWAVAAGVISGTDATHLSPAGKATRAQCATILKSFATWVEGSSGSDEPGVTDITLTVWSAQEDQVDESSWLPQMLNAFEEAHPEYRITWNLSVCNEGDVSIMIDNDPESAADVFLFYNDQIPALVEAGALMKLGGSYLDQVTESVSATYLNTVTHTDGGVYGFPMNPNTWFMYYNKSLLSEEDVKSLEACLEKGIVAFEITNSWYLPSFFFAAGGTMFGEQGNDAAAGVQFGGDVGVNATNAVLDLLDNPNFKVDGDGYGNSGLKDGTVAAYFSGYWDYPGLYEALGENLGAAPAPTVMINGVPSQLKAYACSKAVGVNANSEHPDVAMELASFLASAESQLLRFQLRGVTPAITALAGNEAVASSIVASAELATMSYTSVAQPMIVPMRNVWGPMSTYGNNIANGSITRDNVPEKVAELNAELNSGV